MDFLYPLQYFYQWREYISNDIRSLCPRFLFSCDGAHVYCFDTDTPSTGDDMGYTSSLLSSLQVFSTCWLLQYWPFLFFCLEWKDCLASVFLILQWVVTLYSISTFSRSTHTLQCIL